MLTVWLQRKTGVVEQVEAQLVVGSGANKAGFGGGPRLVDGLGAEIGQFDSFDIAPQQLDRVEVWGVGRQSFYNQPRPLFVDPGDHGLGAMRGQAIPDQGDLLTWEVGVDLLEELDQ